MFYAVLARDHEAQLVSRDRDFEKINEVLKQNIPREHLRDRGITPLEQYVLLLRINAERGVVDCVTKEGGDETVFEDYHINHYQEFSPN